MSFITGMIAGAVSLIALVMYSAHSEWKHNNKNKKP